MDLPKIREAAAKIDRAYKAAQAAKLAQGELGLLFPDELERRRDIGRALSEQADKAKKLLSSAVADLVEAGGELHEKWAEGERALRGEGEFRPSIPQVARPQDSYGHRIGDRPPLRLVDPEAELEAIDRELAELEGPAAPAEPAPKPLEWMQERRGLYSARSLTPAIYAVEGPRAGSGPWRAKYGKDELDEQGRAKMGRGAAFRHSGLAEAAAQKHYDQARKAAGSAPSSRRAIGVPVRLEGAGRAAPPRKLVETETLIRAVKPTRPEPKPFDAEAASAERRRLRLQIPDTPKSLKSALNAIRATPDHSRELARGFIDGGSSTPEKVARARQLEAELRARGLDSTADYLSFEFSFPQARADFPAVFAGRWSAHTAGGTGLGIGAIRWREPAYKGGYWTQEGDELTPSPSEHAGGITRHRAWRIEGDRKGQIRLYRQNLEHGGWDEVSPNETDYKNARHLAEQHAMRAAPTDGRPEVSAVAPPPPPGVKLTGSGWWDDDTSSTPPPVYVGLPVTRRSGSHKRSGVITDANKNRTRITVKLRDTAPARYSWRKGARGYYLVGDSPRNSSSLMLGKGVDYLDPGV